MFNKQKLTLARKFRGKSKNDLALDLSMAQKTISEWENGKAIPKFENLTQLAQVLNFPVDFFTSDDLTIKEPAIVSFRAQTKMRAADRDRAIAHLDLAYLVNEYIENNYNLPINEIPNLENLTPEEASKYLRDKWELDDNIHNAVHLLERHGVRVFSTDETCKEYDALSTWYEDIPFVLLKTTKSAERSRFDAMHELGHLVLHKNIKVRNKEIESEAHRFASEMLMPKKSIFNNLIHNISLNSFIEIKKYWKVSLKAIVYRYHSLNIISDWTYRMLLMQMQKLGYDVNEPDTIEHETSKAYQQIYKLLKEDGSSMLDLARNIGISPRDLNSLTFNLYSLNLVKGAKTFKKPTIKIY